MYDIIIVGGGPVGAYLTTLLEDKFNVLLIEKSPGRKKVCSGLISTNLDKFVTIEKEFLENKVNGAKIHHKGKELVIKKPETAAYVIDRQKFDRYLLDKVKSKFLKAEVSDIELGDEKVSVLAGKWYDCKLLIGCDGANSIVRKRFGFKTKEVLNGLKITLNEEDDSDFVELWYDRKITDGFLWKIPKGKKTEYGGIGKKIKFSDVENFFNIEGERLASLIPIGPSKSYSNRILLVGDSAGQVKPWSGGGVIYGLTAARIAAKFIEQAFHRNDFSEGFLKRYENEWKRVFGKNIRIGMLFRWLYKNIPCFDRLFFSLLKLKRKSINNKDMDLL